MMMSRRHFLASTALAAGAMALPVLPGCAVSRKNVPPDDDARPLLLTHVHVIDVRTGTVMNDAHVMIDDAGRIASLTPGPVEVGEGCRVLDMKGRYLIPGLIDAHCHSTASPVFAMRMTDLARHAWQQKMNYVNTIESGVTTIRDMGAFPGLLHHFIRRIEKGDLPGPRVVYCNSMINVRGGHPEIPPSDVNIFARPAALFIGMIMANITGIDQLNRALEENAEGASFIKLTLDNQTLFCKKNRTIPVYTDEEMAIIFRFAEARGLPVVGHHQFEFGFNRAMDYPFHSIEHVVTDVRLTDEQIKTMAERKTAIVPTLTLAQSFLMDEAYDVVPDAFHTDTVQRELVERRRYFEQEASAHCHPVLHAQNLAMTAKYRRYPRESLFDRKIFLVDPDLYVNMAIKGFDNLKRMKEAGVLIGCGIDAGMPFNYFGGLYREFEIMARLGFSPLEILQCATVNNAKILCIDDRAGTLEPGKWADMVAFDANPLDDIRVLRRPSIVFKEGRMMFSRNPLDLEPI